MSGGDAKALPVGLDENLRVLKTQEGIGLFGRVNSSAKWSRIVVRRKALKAQQLELVS
jgi:hypothetical protein